HHLINETTEEIVYLEVGDRTPGDEGSYPTTISRRCSSRAGGSSRTKTERRTEPRVCYFTAGRTMTTDLSCPGTLPLITSRLFSGTTSTTVRFCTVRRSTPMCPGIRLPLKTRPGVFRCPTAPMCPWSSWLEAESRAAPFMWWRFTTPAKPKPRVVPVT